MEHQPPLEGTHLELKMAEGSRKSLSYSWRPNDASSITPKHDESYQQNIVPSLNDVGKDGDTNRLLSMYLNGVDIHPTHQETTMLNGFRSACQAAIDSLQNKRRQMLLTIEGLSLELAGLEEEMNYKGRQLATASAIVAPIRRLPMELLTKIFRFTLQDEVWPLFRRDSPLVLSHVSKLWRHVVVKDPFLWYQIWCSLPEESCRDDTDEDIEAEDHAINLYRRLLQGINLFSTRSGAVALDLALFDEVSENNIQDPTAQLKEYRKRALEDIRALFPRCRSLGICLLRPSGNPFLVGVRRSVFSRLESLRLSLRRDLPSVPPETNIFSAAPLCRCELHTPFPADLRNFSLQHDKLEHVVLGLSAPPNSSETIARDSVLAWRNFIVKCANLRTAQVQYSWYARVNDQHEQPQTAGSFSSSATMNHLTTLVLRVASNGSFADLLRDIDFPVLDILHLSIPRTSSHMIVPLTPRGKPFTESIERNMPYITRLKALCLTRVHIADKDLCTLLRMTPRLQSLSVLKSRIQEATRTTSRIWLEDSVDLVSFLTIKDADNLPEGFNPPVPALRTLRLYHNEHSAKASPDPATSFSRLAQSRYRWTL
ncbi:hypothetical protein NLJ89_g8308 [Agrocybe chaxingu]|uniref:F-box domain-containing protein n=1 Tax=Agrocybe chaxingu TaxID=84603 RepID=A0A9W8JUP2_9AGAR|nr:hypothetical protein NLJ89_g8308 [Agrocybe chaxingu]